MKKTITFTVLILSFLVNFQSNAQDDNSVYFDDGSISDIKNQIKLEILNLYNGELSLAYNRALFKNLSVELSLGKQLKFYYSEPLLLNADLTANDTITGGYNFSIAPRLLYASTEVRDYYFSYRFKQRVFELPNNTLKYNEHVLMTGTIINFYKHFILDLYSGLGLVNIDNPKYINHSEFTIILGAKIGFIF